MRILLVEDDPSLSEFLARVLSEESFTCTVVETAHDALASVLDTTYDVVILDWMLPDGDGLSVCAGIRAAGRITPILMLTARGEVPDRVAGLRAGADDYLVKPFEVDELLARIEALVRRVQRTATLRIGPLEIDRLQRRASAAGASFDLTLREFDFLLRLAVEDGRPVDRATLLASVWSLRFDPGSGVLDVLVSRLRDKLGAHAPMLQTVRGVGYRLVPAPLHE